MFPGTRRFPHHRRDHMAPRRGFRQNPLANHSCRPEKYDTFHVSFLGELKTRNWMPHPFYPDVGRAFLRRVGCFVEGPHSHRSTEFRVAAETARIPRNLHAISQLLNSRRGVLAEEKIRASWRRKPVTRVSLQLPTPSRR